MTPMFGNDVDDVLALAMLYNYVDAMDPKSNTRQIYIIKPTMI